MPFLLIVLLVILFFFPFKNIQGFKSHMPKLVHDNSEFKNKNS